MTGINDKILVVLDLDETLVHATLNPYDENWDFKIDEYKVYKRPGLDVFLHKLKRDFNVAVWSSASDDYVIKVVNNIFEDDYDLMFVWGRSKCIRKLDYQIIEELGYYDPYSHYNYAKPLKKVKKKGFATLEKVLIIDDTPFKSKQNFGNAIYPTEFNGDQTDNELEILTEYLLTLKDVENVRLIEKRNWKSKKKS